MAFAPLIFLPMTFETALVLTILLVSLVLFVSEWIPMDVTALLVLGTLAVFAVFAVLPIFWPLHP